MKIKRVSNFVNLSQPPLLIEKILIFAKMDLSMIKRFRNRRPSNSLLQIIKIFLDLWQFMTLDEHNAKI